MFAEIPVFTEERIEQEARKHLQKLNDEKYATMLYDPATKKTSSYRECRRSYGETMADKALRKSMARYLYLRIYIVRASYEGDKLGLYEAYFKKGKLAASVSIRTLARDWFMDEKTVSTYLTRPGPCLTATTSSMTQT